EFCRQENISPSAFHHWRNQLSNQRLNESVDDWIELNHPQLDEFETPIVSPPEWNVELVLPGDVILRLRY
ncbi:IS66 family insertion sequence element accessory protein TnpA, partial [Shewanella sairae]